MNRLRCLVAATLLLALTACATPKQAEPDAQIFAAPPPSAEVPIRDRIVIPGERVGPILLGMPPGG